MPQIRVRNSDSAATDSPAAKLLAEIEALIARPEYKTLRPPLRSLARNLRNRIYGYDRAATKRKIMRSLVIFEQLEIGDLVDDTKLPETEILAALDELITAGRVLVGRRRRSHEIGKHYNAIYYPVVRALPKRTRNKSDD